MNLDQARVADLALYERRKQRLLRCQAVVDVVTATGWAVAWFSTAVPGIQHAWGVPLAGVLLALAGGEGRKWLRRARWEMNLPG